MSLDSVIARGRAAAEARMTDTCRITAPGEGQGAWNDEIADYDPPEPLVIYEGICRRKSPDVGGASQADAGPESWDISSSILCLPIDASTGVGSKTQTVEYLTATYDGDLVGRKFGMVGGAQGSQQTERRLHIKEAT